MVSPRLPLLLRPLLFLLLLLLRPASSDWPETRYPEPDIKDMNPHTSGIPSVDRKELIVRYSCGEAGYGEDRVQASIDYTLCCRAMGRRCCMECKCQWALYYQMASACFDRLAINFDVYDIITHSVYAAASVGSSTMLRPLFRTIYSNS